SGTSATPKGAVFTHGTIAEYLERVPADYRKFIHQQYQHLISYLPLAHVFERSVVQLASLKIPCDVSFVESLELFSKNLFEVQPTLFIGVPRIWGVFKQKIEHHLPWYIRKLLFIPGIAFLLKQKIKNKIGLSRCTNAFSGAAHL